MRVARLAEALEVLEILFASNGTPVDFEGRYYQLSGAVFDLPLWEGRRPPLYIGSHAPRMLNLTGRYADGWLPGQPIPAEEYGGRLEKILSAGREAGRSMESFVATQTMLLVLGDDADQVLEQAMRSLYVAYNTLGLAGSVWQKHGLEHPMGDDFAGQIELVPAATSRDVVEMALARMTPELLLEQYYFGSPAQIASRVAPLVGVGCQHFILANMGGNFTGRGSADFASMADLTARLKKNLSDKAKG